MSGALHLLSGGARASGLTRTNPYESLHFARQPKQLREPSPSIFADPRSGSSDEDLDGQEAPDDGASDDSEFGKSEEKGRPGEKRALRTGTDASSALGEDVKKRDLSVEPSNIRAGTLTSSGGRNGSQSNQKRNSVDVNDDPPFGHLQPRNKKLRHSYSHSNMSKHKGIGGSVKKLGNPSKIPSKGSEEAGRSFKYPDTKAVFAQGKTMLRIDVSAYV